MADSTADKGLSLEGISPSAKNENDAPKGFAPYRPYKKSQALVDRILAVYRRFRDQDALPAGPRTIGYRLKEDFRGTYGKADFPNIDRIIKRLNQSRKLPFEWVADASGVTYAADGWDGPVEFLRDAHTLYRRDRRDGQPVVTEVACEARGTLPLIRRLGAQRGVTVYSGGGSCGPGFARKVAARALIRAVEHGQDTLIIGLGDFDQAGIKGVMRPHIEHVAGFLYGTALADTVLAHRGQTMADTGCEVRFRHLGMTPEMALERAETAGLTAADVRMITAYRDSGTGLWDRDVELLTEKDARGRVTRTAAKFELEVMDPVELRDLLISVLDGDGDEPGEGVLDYGELGRVAAEEKAERTRLRKRLKRQADKLEDKLAGSAPTPRSEPDPDPEPEHPRDSRVSRLGRMADDIDKLIKDTFHPEDEQDEPGEA